MEVSDDVLRRAGILGLAILAMEDKEKIAHLNQIIADQAEEIEDLSLKLKVMADGFLIDQAELVVECFKVEGYNGRLFEQRKEIRGLHSKVERLEGELNDYRS